CLKEESLIVYTKFFTGSEYVQLLNNKYKNKVTVSTHLRRVRTYCNWLLENGYIDKKFKFPIKKDYELTKDCYTTEELKRLLTKPTTTDFAEIRNWVAVNILVATGCRISTLTHMQIQDFNFENNSIFYRHTKNRKTQTVPMALTLKKALHYYLTIYSIQNQIFLLA
ncbi:MAG: site-specific integrase, partial [Niameybacter sp.]|uniref:tyrosine-type recombinase/integrase n=1 Tax=Niameybacter sp. TaxID=2033640 RepID=UPI002FC92273